MNQPGYKRLGTYPEAEDAVRALDDHYKENSMRGRESLDERVADALGVSVAEAHAITRAAEPLWNALASHGLVDSYGGAEFRRLLPDALALIREQANSPYEDRCKKFV